MRRRTVGMVFGVAVLGALVAWWVQGGAPDGVPAWATPSGEQGGPMRSVSPKAARRPQVPPSGPVAAAPEAPSMEARDEAYGRLSSGGTVARCDVRGRLEDGLYEVAPPMAEHVEVQGGVLSMRVRAPEGAGRIEHLLAVEGLVSWEGATCTFTAPEWVTVQGTLTDAEGRPAADHAVRGCRFGAFTRTNDAGEWTTEGMAGTTCSPMAFVERDDGAFGKSGAPAVELEAPGPVMGVALVLPAADALWPPEMQRELAVQIEGLYVQRLDASEARLEELDAALEGCDLETDPACRVLDGWRAREQLWVDWVGGEMDRLTDPEEQLDAFRDAWFNLY